MGFVGAMCLLGGANVAQLDSPGEFKHIEMHLQLLGQQYCWIRTAFFDKTTSVRDAAVAIGKLQLSMLQCYRRAPGKYCPAVYYHDVQSTYQSVLISIAKYQVNCPDEPFYMFLIGSDRLENHHCSLRTVEHSSKSDMLQLEERSARACRMEHKYAKHPHWRPYIRRLGRSRDRMNVKTWEGDTSTNFNLRSTLDNAYQHIKDCPIHRRLFGEVDMIMSEALGVTFLKPFGVLVGVSPEESEGSGAEDASGGSVTRSEAEGIADFSDQHEADLVEMDAVLEAQDAAVPSTAAQMLEVEGKMHYKASILSQLLGGPGSKKLCGIQSAI